MEADALDLKLTQLFAGKVVRKDLKCSTCYRNGRVKCRKFDCFSLIDPGDVFVEIKGLLAETGRLRK